MGIEAGIISHERDGGNARRVSDLRTCARVVGHSNCKGLLLIGIAEHVDSVPLSSRSIHLQLPCRRLRPNGRHCGTYVAAHVHAAGGDRRS